MVNLVPLVENIRHGCTLLLVLDLIKENKSILFGGGVLTIAEEMMLGMYRWSFTLGIFSFGFDMNCPIPAKWTSPLLEV